MLVCRLGPLDICFIAATVTALAAAVDREVAGGGARCDQWSAWEAQPWGGTRRRESCADGRLDEQCRIGGIVTACRRPTSIAASDGDHGGGGGGSDVISMPQFNARRTPGKSFAYTGYAYTASSYYYYSTLYSPYYDLTTKTVTCSIGCIAGAVVGTLSGIGFVVGGSIVLYCMFCKQRPRGRVVNPTAMTTTATTVIATSASTGVTVIPSTGLAAYSSQSYSHPEQQAMGVYTTAYTTPYPTTYPAIYPSPYANGYPPAYSSSAYPPTMEVSQSSFPPPYVAM